MTSKISLYCLVVLTAIGATQVAYAQPDKYVIVVHGGAGTILRSAMTPEKEAAYRAGITKALQKGFGVLKEGGSSLDAVTEAVKILEDDSLFNAGKGAVFTHEGRNEMDAAIMDGKNLMAGSIAGVTTIKNPITAARAVMEKSEHVMLTGKGAETFAAEHGCEMVSPAYFFTQSRWNALQELLKKDSADKVNDGKAKQEPQPSALLPGELLPRQWRAATNARGWATNRDYKYGTVGAVALDKEGNLAAATSTGGMTNKKYGRVGDAPIIGCGTYANNNTCAVSCTGWGEYFIRSVVAKTISDRIEWRKDKLPQATNAVLEDVAALGGDGGLIAVDKKGNISMDFNTEGMYRGYLKANGEIVVEIFK